MLSLSIMADESKSLREKIAESISSPLVELFDKKGITLDYLSDKLKEELDASIPKLFQSDGKVVESREIPVYDIRQRARQDAHKLRGDYPVERKQISIDGAVPVIPLSDEEQIELEATKEMLRKRIKTK